LQEAGLFLVECAAGAGLLIVFFDQLLPDAANRSMFSVEFFFSPAQSSKPRGSVLATLMPINANERKTSWRYLTVQHRKTSTGIAEKKNRTKQI
jgi:hypothetical protein